MPDTPTPAHRFALGQTYTTLNATWPLSDYDLKFNITVAGHARVMAMEIMPTSYGGEKHRMTMHITYEKADGTITEGGMFSREIEFVSSRDAEAFILSTLGDGWWWSADMTGEETCVDYINWREELAKPSPPAYLVDVPEGE